MLENTPQRTEALIADIDFYSPDRFLNRELSWIAFNERVMAEARNPAHPVLERVRFLSISAANLDEFFMVKVASLQEKVFQGASNLSPEGLTPIQQLAAVNGRAAHLLREQRTCLLELLEELKKNGIRLMDFKDLNAEEMEWLEHEFTANIYPILTPLAIGPTHPFPFIPTRGLALALQLHDENAYEDLDAIILLPPLLDRFIRLPGEEPRFLPIEQAIVQFLDRLFPPFTLISWGVFRVLRDGDLELDEDSDDLFRTFESALKRRRRNDVVRLIANASISPQLLGFLSEQLEVEGDDIDLFDGLIGITDIRQLIVHGRPELCFPSFIPRMPERLRDFNGDCFAAIRAKDFVIHHPYESFDVVVQFLRQAARDPDVMAIKQTLYRTSADSPIVQALIEAAEAGKSVTAVVEVRARFDEEANIKWAKDLERAGAQVVFGVLDLKTHAKVSFVVRRESEGMRFYMHLGTGNYHPHTARIYTDLSFFTCDAAMGRDAAAVFNYMTGYATPRGLEKMAIAPVNMREKLYSLIDAEIDHAKAGRPAQIWAKMNALVDPEMIDRLYRASEAGVEIDLIVRGMCALRPGVPGLSENIRVRSIVGRFLEHSRIMCFGNGVGLPSRGALVFISSADWMGRNLNRRIETLVPIENPTVHQQVLDQIMVACLKDDVQSWILGADGIYRRSETGRNPFSAHRYFMTNPSLSGRGSALSEHRTPPRLVLTRSKKAE